MRTISNLVSGKPLNDKSADEFGYGDFAAHLSKTIAAMKSPEGTVFAVYGPWGSGKTTLLNLIRSEIDAVGIESIDFNAWSFSSSHDLVRRFFEQLISRFPRGKGWDEVTRGLADLSELVSEALPKTDVGTIAAVIAKSRSIKKKDLNELKEQITKTLVDKKKRFVVFVDDIDRLDSRAIQDLFSVIKSVADFPNIVYVLAFDFEVVSEILGKLQGINGASYLEKIVQISFNLPVPDRKQLGRVLISRLREIWGADMSKDILSSSNFWHLFKEGILPLTTTPRQVNRLAVTLSITFEAVKNEVDAIDFLGMEALRMFSARVYETIRNSPSSFAGPSLGRVSEHKEFHERWIEKENLSKSGAVMSIVDYLFPKVLASISGGAESDSDSTYPRIQSLRAFPAYFRFSVADGAVSMVEMKSLLALADNSTDFCEKMRELAGQLQANGNSRAQSFFERMEDFYEDVGPQQVYSLLKALFELGDDVWVTDDDISQVENELDTADVAYLMAKLEFMGLHSTGPGYIVWKLLAKVDPKNRFQALMDAMAGAKGVYVTVAVSRFFEAEERSAEKKSRKETLFTKGETKKISDWTLARIRQMAKDYELLSSAGLKQAVDFYASHDFEECKEWLSGVLMVEEYMPTVVELFLEKSRILGGRYPKDVLRLNVSELGKFASIGELKPLAQLILEQNTQSGTRRIALQKLISINSDTDHSL